MQSGIGGHKFKISSQHPGNYKPNLNSFCFDCLCSSGNRRKIKSLRLIDNVLRDQGDSTKWLLKSSQFVNVFRIAQNGSSTNETMYLDDTFFVK